MAAAASGSEEKRPTAGKRKRPDVDMELVETLAEKMAKEMLKEMLAEASDKRAAATAGTSSAAVPKRKKRGRTPTPSERAAEQKRVADLVASFDPLAIVCWCDGSAGANSGSSPTGSGVAICAPDGLADRPTIARLQLIGSTIGPLSGIGVWHEISTYHGLATNNIGELHAIFTAVTHVLGAITTGDATTDVDDVLSGESIPLWTGPVEILTDSDYSIGVLGPNKAHKNAELVRDIRAKLADLRKLRSVRLHHVRAHHGVAGNERVDKLAELAAALGETA